MSTLGKVLVALIALPLLAWLWLASGIAELNRNWGKRIVEVDGQIAQAKADILTTRGDITAYKNRIDLAQRERDERLTTLRGLVSQLYKAESYSKETLERFSLQRTGLEQDAAAAQRRLDGRVQELADTKKAVSDAQTELAQLKEDNSRDRGQLEMLRMQFRSTLEENRSLVENSRASHEAAARSLPRAVSLAR